MAGMTYWKQRATLWDQQLSSIV